MMTNTKIPAYFFTFSVRAISKDNEKHFNRSGRYFLSKKFKQFEENLRMMFLSQRTDDFQIFTCPISVDIKCHFKNKVHCDTQNLPKSICDAFNKVIWNDDRQIKRITVESKDVNETEEKITLAVYPYSEV